MKVLKQEELNAEKERNLKVGETNNSLNIFFEGDEEEGGGGRDQGEDECGKDKY